MAHPFEKMLYSALKKSTEEENMVLETARTILERGYSAREVCGVLEHLEKSLVDDAEASIVREAREELCEEDV